MSEEKISILYKNGHVQDIVVDSLELFLKDVGSAFEKATIGGENIMISKNSFLRLDEIVSIMPK